MSKKQELLDYIAKNKKEAELIKALCKQKDIATIKAELEYIQGRKTAALIRATEQEAAGDRVNARRSRRAYKFCCKYERQLANIIEGYKGHPGKHYTKNGTQRYIDARELPRK